MFGGSSFISWEGTAGQHAHQLWGICIWPSFLLKKKKTPIESYPFSGLPLSFLAGYISHVRHKFTSVLHKPLSYLVMVTVSY